MTASCAPITAARLASIASSQSKNRSGPSATPSRDNNSYTTIFRTTAPPLLWLQLSTSQAAESHRRKRRRDRPGGRGLRGKPGFPRKASDGAEGAAANARWGREDSNLRRLSRRVYSPFPLATRAHPRGSKV